ncbi:unnamed protein product [Timema podura]|uniref:Uncharacterized protein n=1 Tax=Timema podura TaxID=61482 RepID=A0ABN7NH16_TIMPD|nr:unnamed protein product [Timema podura]
MEHGATLGANGSCAFEKCDCQINKIIHLVPQGYKSRAANANKAKTYIFLTRLPAKTMVHQPTNSAPEASFKVAEFIAKNTKPHVIGGNVTGPACQEAALQTQGRVKGSLPFEESVAVIDLKCV